MTNTQPTLEAPVRSAAWNAGSSASGTDTSVVHETSVGRLVGVDLARALAVFGMYAVHIGPSLSATDGLDSWIRYLVDGRSSILFATLAGFSLVLMAGRLEPKIGRAGRQAKARITIRAVVLIAVGTVMTMAYGNVVILAFYGLYFLIALPLVRLTAKTLALIAAVLAIVTPQLAFAVKLLLTESIQQSINAYDPLDRISGVGLMDLLLTGFYPTITWIPFVIAGMALGRLDLARGTVQRRVAALGTILVVLGYGTSRLLSGQDALRGVAESKASFSMSAAPKAQVISDGFEPQMSVSELLLAGPHSGTSFDIIGGLGVAILVIVCSILAMERLPRLRRLAKPVIAVGAMSLTAYVGHFIAQSVFSVPEETAIQQSWTPLLAFILGAILFASLWSRFFRRGPLEHLLHVATIPAKYVR